MKSVDWGSLYNECKDVQLDTDKIAEITKNKTKEIFVEETKVIGKQV